MIRCTYNSSSTLGNYGEAESAFIELSKTACEKLLASVNAPQSRFSGLDLDVRVLFGTEDDLIEHGTEDDALGMFYMAMYDPTDDEYDIPDEFLCIVNVPANLTCIHEHGGDRAAIEAAAVTAPHEVMHAIQFARDHGGRPPVEVFDDDQAEFLRIARGGRDDRSREKEAEEMAGSVTWGIDTSRLEKSLSYPTVK